MYLASPHHNQKETKKCALVLKVLRGVAVCYPAAPHSYKIELDLKPEALELWPILDLTNFRVANTEMWSPLHWHLEGSDEPYKFGFKIKVGAKPVLEWQAERTFANVPEMAIRNMIDEMGGADFDYSWGSDIKASDRLAMMLTMMVRPELDEASATKQMMTRQLMEHEPSACYLDDITDEQIQDCVLVGDQKETKEIVKQRAKAMQTRRADQEATRELIKQCFPKVQAVLKKAISKKDAAAKLAAMEHDRSRFYDGLDRDATEALRFALPNSCRLVPDAKNGRWFINHPSFKQRSVSWTQRGHQQGAKMVLRQAWGWHHATTGEEPPAHLLD